MHHAQIAFEQPEYEFLLAEARRLGTDVAALVRGYVAEKMAPPAEDDPLEGILGIGVGTGEDVGRNHDLYIYGVAKPRCPSS